MRTISIGVVLNYWSGWGGGVAFITSFLRGVIGPHFTVSLLIRVSPETVADQMVLELKAQQLDASPIREIVDCFPELKTAAFFDYRTATEFLALNFVGFCGGIPPVEIRDKWIGYLPDFQHAYLPENFSESERIARDNLFRSTIENSLVTLVNSPEVRADVYRFYPGSMRTGRVWQLPAMFPRFKHRDTTVLNENNLMRRRYIISCSQAWPHKRHDLIIKAFINLRKTDPYYSTYKLVFTASRDAYNDPGGKSRIQCLIDEEILENNIIFTGHLSKEKQLDLLYNATCLIQASEFEGGLGSSGMIECAMLGVPMLASDIRVNMEIDYGNVRFFKSGSEESLSECLREDIIKYENYTREIPVSEDEINLCEKHFSFRIFLRLRTLLSSSHTLNSD